MKKTRSRKSRDTVPLNQSLSLCQLVNASIMPDPGLPSGSIIVTPWPVNEKSFLLINDEI
jgi:hypothetical protein